jgi:hypothetical protein
LLRILLKALTILSLLFFLAIAGLWVRSYWRTDTFGWRRGAGPGEPQWWFGLSSAGGGAMVFASLYAPPSEPQRLSGGWYWHCYDAPIRYAGGSAANRWGFGRIAKEDAYIRQRALVFPAWAAAVFCAARGGAPRDVYSPPAADSRRPLQEMRL